jgi:hypothetical protein
VLRHGHSPAASAQPARRPRTPLRWPGPGTVSGAIPIVFADYDIGNPSFGSFVTTGKSGTLEFLVRFSRS